MKILGRSLSGASLALLLVQLALVSTIAAKYEVQRWRCPRVWTRAFGYDPQLPLRGRYLSLQLRVDGCQSTLPSAREARFPRAVNGAAVPGPYTVRAVPGVGFDANLKVEKNQLLAVRIPDEEQRRYGQPVLAPAGEPCSAMVLERPVEYYIPDKAQSVLPLKTGQELWIEVTVPLQGPPRPTQLAIKENGAWKPLGF